MYSVDIYKLVKKYSKNDYLVKAVRELLKITTKKSINYTVTGKQPGWCVTWDLTAEAICKLQQLVTRAAHAMALKRKKRKW